MPRAGIEPATQGFSGRVKCPNAGTSRPGRTRTSAKVREGRHTFGTLLPGRLCYLCRGPAAAVRLSSAHEWVAPSTDVVAHWSAASGSMHATTISPDCSPGPWAGTPTRRSAGDSGGPSRPRSCPTAGGGDEIGFHTLRHSGASILANAGVLNTGGESHSAWGGWLEKVENAGWAHRPLRKESSDRRQRLRTHMPVDREGDVHERTTQASRAGR